MSDDDDWEFTALEKDKRSVPELVIDVGGKSYADAVLQHTDREKLERTALDAEKRPTLMKVNIGRKTDVGRGRPKIKKNDKVTAIFMKREAGFSLPNHLIELAEEFALSDDCAAMMAQMDVDRRMPYTKLLHNKF